ncbi:hypothetical protein BJX76DRAFT_357842 [Aspergillus varians]
MERPDYELHIGMGPESILTNGCETVELGAQWVLILRPVGGSQCTLYYASRDVLPSDSENVLSYYHYYRTRENQKFPHPWFTEEKVKLLSIIPAKKFRLFEKCFYDEMPSHHRDFIFNLIHRLACHGLVDRWVTNQMYTTTLYTTGELLYNGDGWGEVDLDYVHTIDDYIDSLSYDS